jgi:SAM-dependent MidA family methyltransferase
VAGSLAERLRALIAARGPLSFADWMTACLYDQVDGYYASGRPIGGHGSDFTTAPAAHPAFGRAVAREVDRVWEELGRPDVIDVVEVGAGEGVLAERVLAAVRAPVRYVLVDRSEGMRRRQRERLGEDPRVRWADDGADLVGVRGAIISNELFDALPVRLFDAEGELRVDLLESGEFVWETRWPRAGRVRAIAMGAVTLYRSLATGLAAGELWTLDYGGDGPASEFRVYRGGFELGMDAALEWPGTRDITADVDFGSLRAAGEAAGLETVRDEPQSRWLTDALVATGDDDRGPATEPEAERLRALTTPGGIGDSFRVLVQRR